MATSSSADEEIGQGLNDKHTDLIVKFVCDVRRRKFENSEKIALTTISILEQIIADSENATVLELCASVRAAGRMISRALPNEFVAANMVRRVLRAIRDESRAQVDQNVEVAGESLQRLVQAATVRRATLGAAATDLREPIRDHIAELVAEVESSNESICSSAHSHVHADELILTYGSSELVEQFLKAAAPRGFRLVHAAGPDVEKSHEMSARLSEAGICVTVIDPEAMFAFMSRVNKVVIGVLAVLAGGGLLGEAGASLATGAAHFYSVPVDFMVDGYRRLYTSNAIGAANALPTIMASLAHSPKHNSTYSVILLMVIALAPLYKLSPLHASDDQFNELGDPRDVMTYPEASGVCEYVSAPLYDPVPSEHVTLFITNLGGSSPSYIYRLLSELYDPNDDQLL